jgi:hypothetical protein
MLIVVLSYSLRQCFSALVVGDDILRDSRKHYYPVKTFDLGGAVSLPRLAPLWTVYKSNYTTALEVRSWKEIATGVKEQKQLNTTAFRYTKSGINATKP